MLIIRREQFDALSRSVMGTFEQEMLVHLAGFSPPLFKAVHEQQMKEVVRFGISRASEYSFTFRGPVRLYLELMLLFGSHFDTDPQYPWASEILQDREFAPQMQRAERLYDRLCDYRTKVAGPQDVYTLQALQKLSILAEQQLSVTQANFFPAILAEMARVYPQKTAYVGTDAMTALIGKGAAAAQTYAFSSDRAVALPTVLMFAFGHGCFEDPMYSWIGRTVNDATISDAEARAKRLEKRALTWLNHVLAYFSEGGHS